MHYLKPLRFLSGILYCIAMIFDSIKMLAIGLKCMAKSKKRNKQNSKEIEISEIL